VIETAPKEPSVSGRSKGRTRAQLLPPVVWRLSGVFAAVVLCGLLFLVGPGSVEIVARAPDRGAHLAATTPSWARPCFRGHTSSRYSKLAFCARVVGRVLASQTMGGEPHLLVSGGFHFTLVELRPGARVPPLGSDITAIGPLFRGELGLRELKTLWVSH
jgi:hypothetical protein